WIGTPRTGQCGPAHRRHPVDTYDRRNTSGGQDVHGLVSAATAAGSGGGGSIGNVILPVILILGVFYIVSLQRRRTKAQQEQASKLAPGALVITTAGLYATVVEIEDGDVLLEIAPDVVCRFTRSAIARIVSTSGQEGAEHGEGHDEGPGEGEEEHDAAGEANRPDGA